MVEQRYKDAQRQADLVWFRIQQKETTDPLAAALISEVVIDLEAEDAQRLQPNHPHKGGN